MKEHTSFMALAMALLICGCATAPPKETLAAVDYGAIPDLSTAQKQIEDRVRNAAKDPDSVQFRNFHYVGTGWYKFGIIVPPHFGHRYSAEYNAKNSFGGYVGFKTVYAVVHSNQLTLLGIDNGSGEIPTILVNGPTHKPGK